MIIQTHACEWIPGRLPHERGTGPKLCEVKHQKRRAAYNHCQKLNGIERQRTRDFGDSLKENAFADLWRIIQIAPETT